MSCSDCSLTKEFLAIQWQKEPKMIPKSKNLFPSPQQRGDKLFKGSNLVERAKYLRTEHEQRGQTLWILWATSTLCREPKESKASTLQILNRIFKFKVTINFLNNWMTTLINDRQCFMKFKRKLLSQIPPMRIQTELKTLKSRLLEKYKES